MKVATMTPGKTCDRPPTGWFCKLMRGHEGSCPTYPRWWRRLLGQVESNCFKKWSPLLLIWRVRHHFFGRRWGCSCTTCFMHPKRSVPNQEFIELRRRLYRLEEKVAAKKYPKLIVTTSIRQGELAARQLGLRKTEYAIKQSPEALRGYSGAVEVYVVHPFLNMRPSFADTLSEVGRLEAKGATVREITT